MPIQVDICQCCIRRWSKSDDATRSYHASLGDGFTNWVVHDDRSEHRGDPEGLSNFPGVKAGDNVD